LPLKKRPFWGSIKGDVGVLEGKLIRPSPEGFVDKPNPAAFTGGVHHKFSL
jgi:hypothetical protein